eukprot:TRINITY_DN759_c0_g2_i1.p1 TRINITY_DN759_c0_g2~~TRINITY_DN759_c0_g2_i1.p1  ORF type:complete len:390 (-),score=44.34 TRINITY_DN759_c0_g2_i1:63-1232(-)
MVSFLVFVTVTAHLLFSASLAVHRRPSSNMLREVETIAEATRVAGLVSVPKDRSLISQCSLQQHASAEMALLRSGLDSSAESLCSSSMDVGAKGLVYLRFLKGLPPGGPRQTVWVTGFPRSSTSTVLSMISAGQTEIDDVDGGRVTFSLFEPCHDGDEYVENMTCADMFLQLSRCNFAGVNNLWGWTDSHTSTQNGSHDEYSVDAAAALCGSADTVAFKTVDPYNKQSDFFWLLDEAPELRRIDVIRDPRGIYASWKTTEPFKSFVESGFWLNISGICDTFLENLNVSHDHLYRLVSEKLVQDPEATMRDVYSFLGLEFGERQMTWLHETLNTTECPEQKPTEVGFSDCHTNGEDTPQKWRSVLSEEEVASFRETPSCQQIADIYGFVP